MTNGLRVNDYAPVGERPSDIIRGRVGAQSAGVDSIGGITITGTPTDDQLLQYDSATDTWTYVDPATLAITAGEFSYVEQTSAVTVTATTEGTANTVVTSAAVTYDGSTIVLVEFFCWAVATGTAIITLVLYDGASAIGQLGTSGAAITVPYHVARRLTPSNASHTYSIRAYVDAGTGHCYAGGGGAGVAFPTFIRITKV